MKVAVITRTKDRKVFLRRAFASVGSQTFKDYIHVVVNDGGDSAIVDQMVESLPDSQKNATRVFHRTVSSNAPDTIFNESIDRISSEYVALHDDDDTWHPEFLERAVAHLDANSDLGGVVVCANKIVEEVSGDTIKELKTTPWMPDMKVISLYRQCIDNQLTPIATVFRRSAYELVGKFDSALPVVGDWEFGLRLLQQYDVDFLDPGFALANYHHRNSGVNSFANHNHRYYFNKIANKYLRRDIESGSLGLGYIISDLKYRQATQISLVKKFMPKFMIGALKRKID